LGCLLYEICTLRHAFDARSLPALIMKIMKGGMGSAALAAELALTHAHTNHAGRYKPLSPAFSPELHHLIDAMLTQEPEKRPS
jgi:NIMA (never in mitosis gene a)-related kinase